MKTLYLLLLLLISSFLLTSCTSNLSSDSSPTIPPASSSLIESDNDLAETCSRGWSCTSPRCGDWVDSNHDGTCDRSLE